MRKKYFLTEYYDVGLRFESDRNTKNLQDLFQQMIKLELFDGVNKIEKGNGKRGTRCVLTSKDNIFKLELTNKDISASFYNEKLDTNISPYLLTLFSVVEEVYSIVFISRTSIPRAARFRHMLFSPDQKDREMILNKYFRSEIIQRVRDVDFMLDLDGQEYENRRILEDVNIMSDRLHSDRLHTAYTKKTNNKTLNPVRVYHIRGSNESIDKNFVKGFLETSLGSVTSMEILDRLDGSTSG